MRMTERKISSSQGAITMRLLSTQHVLYYEIFKSGVLSTFATLGETRKREVGGAAVSSEAVLENA